MAETDLYRPIKLFLERQGYAVKGEVRDCDIVAVRGDEAPVIVEMKTGFSLPLLLQGVDRQAMSDAVYLAFGPPKRRQKGDIVKLCKRLGLGVLVVTGDFVEPLADPLPYQPRRNARRTTLLLKEFAHRVGDPNIGGSTRRPRMTAYRQDALRIAALLAGAGATKVASLRKQTGVTRAAAILQDDVYGWFQRESRGVYGLTPKGLGALDQFAEAVAALGSPGPARQE
ncbi:DUF2161 family putative PD-(D/E)XK-type phosphodiesterase [Rhabdaerophilum sp. SD176]|uniref:DUF2161 domain-containing phosphodiesterase n=1 Tax=Rhabdaerophilum sp. SD176 TaxID=2983548 RepID=UPI0024DF6E78|nr:DUF2161 family putative PD-(D/E)XK-type phosphodiesterase [Rhabdaerophilum sp. SD176]